MAAGSNNYNPALWMQGNPNYYGIPQSPDYNAIYDQSMNLTPQVQAQLGAINTKGIGSAVDAYRNEAMRKNPSAWANLSKQEQDMLQAQSQDKGAASVRGQTAGELSTLGSSGGLSSGARERAATAGAHNAIDMTQDLSRQGNLNKMQIGINDEKNRVSQLSQLPGMEAAALQPQFQKEGIWQNAANQNNQNTIAANQNANQWNQNLYQTQMQAWGANKQANATENAGKK